MRAPFRKSDKIAGVEIPRRRFTLWAGLYFLGFFVVPVLGVAAALDAILYLVFERVFGVCYAIFCLLG